MKRYTLLPFCSFLAAGILTAAGQAETKNTPNDANDPASEAKPESELRSTGITFSLEEESLLLTPENVKIPLTFVRTTVTPLVDETGKAVPWDQIRVGIPLTVQYTTLGDKMVATKVVVTRYMVEGGKEVAAVDEDGKKRAELALIKHLKTLEAAEKTKTQPVTGGGTIMGFEQVIAVGDGNGGDVTQYVVNNSTQYVTPGGRPVAPGLVRTGVRVDVKFIENNGRKIATQMVLHGLPAQGVFSGGGPPQNAGTTASGAEANNNTGAVTTTNTGTGGGTTTAWVDQFGNIIPGTLETGFLNPPVTVLPGSRIGAGNVTGTGTVNGNANANTNVPAPGNPQQPVQPGVNNQPTPAQPNTTPTQPNTAQPNTTQPNTTRPNTTQPGTRQPSTRPSTTRPGTASPSNGSSGAPAPAPGPGR